MNGERKEAEVLKQHAVNVGVQLATILIDSVFLVAWLLIQYCVNKYIVSKFQLAGIDLVVMLVFQVIFAVSTVAPVLISLWSDILIMINRAKNKVVKAASDNGGYDER